MGTHRPHVSLRLRSLSSGLGVAFGWGGVQERSPEALVIPMKAEAWSPALRLGPALGPADSKVSSQPQGWTAGPSPVLPSPGPPPDPALAPCRRATVQLCAPKWPGWTPRALAQSEVGIGPALVPTGAQSGLGMCTYCVPHSQGWAPGDQSCRWASRAGMEALTGRGLCPFPRRGHLKRLTRRSEQSQGGRVWAAEAQADTVGKRGGGVLGVPVRSRGVGWGGRLCGERWAGWGALRSWVGLLAWTASSSELGLFHPSLSPSSCL